MPTSVIAGRLAEIGPGFIVLGEDLRITVPAAISLAGCRIGDSVSVVAHHEGEVIVAEHVKRNVDELRFF
jgi:hypothetical protein